MAAACASSLARRSGTRTICGLAHRAACSTPKHATGAIGASAYRETAGGREAAVSGETSTAHRACAARHCPQQTGAGARSSRACTGAACANCCSGAETGTASGRSRVIHRGTPAGAWGFGGFAGQRAQLASRRRRECENQPHRCRQSRITKTTRIWL